MFALSKLMGPCTRSANRVGTFRHAEADRARRARGLELRDLLRRKRQAAPIVGPRPARGFGLLPGLLEPLRGAIAVIRAALGDETVRQRAIPIEALRLEIRGVRSAHFWTLVPLEAQPAEPVEDACHHVGRRSLDVRVLDAEHERAAVAARVQIVEERGTGAADVEIAGRRGREAKARKHGSSTFVVRSS